MIRSDPSRRLAQPSLCGTVWTGGFLLIDEFPLLSTGVLWVGGQFVDLITLLVGVIILAAPIWFGRVIDSSRF